MAYPYPFTLAQIVRRDGRYMLLHVVIRLNCFRHGQVESFFNSGNELCQPTSAIQTNLVNGRHHSRDIPVNGGQVGVKCVNRRVFLELLRELVTRLDVLTASPHKVSGVNDMIVGSKSEGRKPLDFVPL